MLLSQRSPYQLGLGGYNYDGEFNKPLVIMKASIPFKEDDMKKVKDQKKDKRHQ